MKWKRGMALSTVMVILLLLAFLVIGMQFASRLNAATKEYADITQCRNSLIANAYARVHASDERLAINCKQRDDLVISYSDIRHGRTVQGKKVAIMDILADELATTHYRFIGDVHNATPFANEEGLYCLIDRRISFDDRIKQDEDLETVENFMTYLINAQKSRDVYYSEYLYGYRKQVREDLEFSDMAREFADRQLSSVDSARRAPIEDIIARSALPDLYIDTSLDYYSIHMVAKGLHFLDRIDRTGVVTDYPLALESGMALAGACGGGGVASLLAIKLIGAGGWVSATGVGATVGLPVLAVGGVLLAGCAAYSYAGYNAVVNTQQNFVKMTLLVPVESFRDLRCTEVHR